MFFAKEVRIAARIAMDRDKHLRETEAANREAALRSHRESVNRARREGENQGVRSVIYPVENAIKRGLQEQLINDLRLPLANEAEKVARSVAGRLISEHVSSARLSLDRVHEQKATRVEFHIPAMTRGLMVAE